MNVGVAYADKFRQVWLKLEVPDNCTVRDAIDHSGILEQFPEIDLTTQKVGIFGKLTKLTAPVSDGERIEIYREITADPELVERRDT
ncbi:MAG: RnfH family protein [Gammaproteobacteria bacterium]|nr:RnfH family protein [Gammaproteobacteria bacterium]